MRKVTCFELCFVVVAVVLAVPAVAQQRVPGAGPPSPQFAQPPEQRALQGDAQGISGSAALPHPQAGAQNSGLNRNSLSGINRNTGTTPNRGVNISGPVQPLYENSAAVSGPVGDVPIEGSPVGSGPAGGVPAGRVGVGIGGQTMPTDLNSNAGIGRGRLGVFLIEGDGAGVRVGRVADDSAAARAGLKSGDIILQVNGHGAASPDVAARMIRSIPAGEMVTLTLWRDGNQQQVQVAMEALRDTRQAAYLDEGESLSSSSSSKSQNGDLSGRMSRLEQQLAVVTEELQRVQQELKQLRGAGGSPAAFGDDRGSGTTPGGAGPDVASQPTTKGADQNAAPQSGTTPAGTTPAGAANSDDLFGPTTPNGGKP